MDPRTKKLLEAPIASTLISLAIPNMLVMFSQAAIGLIETYFVGKLGTDALAAMSLVFPLVMFMQMTSAGAMGGGIASSIARALGSGNPTKANALVFHAIAIGIGFGLIFMIAVLFGGSWLFQKMGGIGASLEGALIYSYWVFGGAVLVWLFNCLSAVIRGTGNMNFPAKVTVLGMFVLIPLSPLLIFGWGPIPGFGIAGGAIALLIYYIGGTIALLAYLYSEKSLLKPRWGQARFEKVLFKDILYIGLAGTISTISTNLAIGVTTAFVGGFGPEAIAGYGTGSRLEYVLVPLVFGFGAPMVAMVGTAVGAGMKERAMKITWTGAAMACAMSEVIGLTAAFFPRHWLGIFDKDPSMMEVGTNYLHIVGPFYGFFGLALVLYFASQGAGKLLWPVIGNLVRLFIAIAGCFVAVRAGWGLTGIFAAQATALVCYAAINTTAIAKGVWFKK